MSDSGRLVLTRSMLRIPLALVAIGVIGLAVGLAVAPQRTWLNLLVDGFYVMSIGVSGIFFFATQRLSSAKWSAPMTRGYRSGRQSSWPRSATRCSFAIGESTPW